MTLRGLSPNPNFLLVDDSQPPGYVDVLKKEQCSTNRLADPLFGRRMNLQPDDTERPLGRESHHISEIGIQRNDYTSVRNREPQDLLVGCSREANLKDRNRIVPLGSQVAERGFRPGRASLVREDDLIGSQPRRVFQASPNVLRPELRICVKYDVARLTSSLLFQNQIDGNSGAFQARLPHHDLRSSLNQFRQLHTHTLAKKIRLEMVRPA